MTERKSKHGGARPGAGRPPTFRDAVLFQLRLERSDVEKLNRLAKRKGIAAREIVRRALRTYLNRYGGK